MSYLAACLIVLAAAATAGGASFLLRAVVGNERSQHREFGGQVFQQVGIMFSVLLSFVFSEVWSEYNIAAQAVSRECAALHGAAMLAGTLPESRGEAVSKEILVYAHTVTAIEWPAMTRLRNSPEASTAFHILFDRAAKISAPGASDLAIRSQIVSLLADAHSNREARLFQNATGLPLFIWAVLIAMAVLLDGFLIFAGTEMRSHIILASAASGFMAAALVMVRMLDRPFEGDLAVSSGDFIRLADHVSALLGK